MPSLRYASSSRVSHSVSCVPSAFPEVAPTASITSGLLPLAASSTQLAASMDSRATPDDKQRMRPALSKHHARDEGARLRRLATREQLEWPAIAPHVLQSV